VRDYVYVKDVARTYLDVAERLDEKEFRGEAFNCSNETPVTVLEIVKIIQDLMTCGHLKPKILNSVRGEIFSQYLSSRKLRRMLKWKPRFDLKRGLSETIEWYHEFLGPK
jgi:CDP-glucose 4,6-dehydratase